MLNIATKELRYILLSPIGWIVVAVFAIQSSSRFMRILDWQYQRYIAGRGPESWAETLFTTSGGSVFQNTLWQSYLFVPLVTMAVFSREYSSGSIKLLLSSPVRATDIVLGKYVGVCLFILIMLTGLFVTPVTASFIVESFDFSATVPGITGIFLLLSAYAAVGLFVSSLTRYQIVAAIATLATLFVLRSMETWFQSTPILNELTHWMSLSGRAETFRSGLISSNQVAYFAIVTSLFLAATALRLNALRTGFDLKAIGTKSIAFLGVMLVLGFSTSHPQLSKHIDMTYDRRNSLSPESREIMNRIDGPWEVVTYANVLDSTGHIAFPGRVVQDRGRYRQYTLINPDLSMSYVPFFDIDGAGSAFRRPEDGRSDEEVVLEYVRSVGLPLNWMLTAEEADRVSPFDLEAEGFRTLRLVRWKGKEVLLRHFDDSFRFPMERTTAAAFRRLVEGPYVVGYFEGYGDRSLWQNSAIDYEANFTRRNQRFSLINHGFEFTAIAEGEIIPDNVDGLLIADPEAEYPDERTAEILEFLASGRDLMVLVEPESTTSVTRLLEAVGIRPIGALRQDHNGRYPDDLVLTDIEWGVLGGYWRNTDGDEPVVVDGGVALSFEQSAADFLPTPLLEAKDAFLEPTPLRDSETPNGLFLGYGLEREIEGRIQRVIVLGDADLFSNANVERQFPTSISTVYMESFHWITSGRFPVQRTRREPIDSKILIGSDYLDVLRWTLLGAFPGLVLLLGGFVLLKRRGQ